MKLYLTKTFNGLAPADVEAEVWLRKKKLGSILCADVKQVRNYAFHKKLFALLNLAFEYWEPGEISSKYGVPEKNFERFRKDITILAGYYHIVIRLDGTAKPEADSISFARMEEETFQKLYSDVLDALIKRIPMLKKMGKEDVNRAVDKLLEFA